MSDCVAGLKYVIYKCVWQADFEISGFPH